MVLALDVHYRENIAQAVGILFNWQDETPREIIIDFINGVNDYVPGEFYKRELPSLLKICEKLDLEVIEAIIVDGYVYLDNDKKKGLGAHLWEELKYKIPIIGVAKTFFLNNTETVIKVVRGTSKKPLYVSAVGLNLDNSASLIKNMKGEFRMPTLLKKLDTLTKEEQQNIYISKDSNSIKSSKANQ